MTTQDAGFSQWYNSVDHQVQVTAGVNAGDYVTLSRMQRWWLDGDSSDRAARKIVQMAESSEGGDHWRAYAERAERETQEAYRSLSQAVSKSNQYRNACRAAMEELDNDSSMTLSPEVARAGQILRNALKGEG
jgi:hypothetical protein